MRRAYIADVASPWTIRTDEMVDYLTNGTITIRVAVLNDGDSFRIVTRFEDAPAGIMYSPSRIGVEFDKGGGIERGEVLSCSNGKLSRFYAPVEEPIAVNKGDGVCLLFARRLPPGGEFVMYLHDSVIQNGITIDVPPILFRKTIFERKVPLRWGI